MVENFSSTRSIIVLVASTSAVLLTADASTSTIPPAFKIDQVIRRIGKESRASGSCPGCGRIGQGNSFRWRRNWVGLLQYGQIFTYWTARLCRIAPVDSFVAGLIALPTDVRLDYAGVGRKPFVLDQALGHTTSKNGIEQLAKRIAVTETAVSIFGKARMVWDLVLQP